MGGDTHYVALVRIVTVNMSIDQGICFFFLLSNKGNVLSQHEIIGCNRM